MSLKYPLLAVGALLSVSTFNAQASLTGYTVNGVGLVYSSVSDVTWTKDANLFQTIFWTNSNLINQLTTLTPSYDDNSWGVQTIDSSHFDGNGTMTWWAAKAFVNYLNSIFYGGSNQWRLPTSNAIPGYNGTAGNELGQLFYNELGGTAGSQIPKTIFFVNQQSILNYWTGAEYASSPTQAWLFGNFTGNQGFDYKNSRYYAWAVSPGRVAAVPLPAASWFMINGLLGFFGLKRPQKQKHS